MYIRAAIPLKQREWSNMSDIQNRTDFTGKSHIVLITGGSGSGKSAFAENLVLKQPAENRYYLATMQVYGSEGRERVMRHRQLRHGKGFETLEYPTDVADCIGKIHQPTDAVVLLECMSNLVANEMFTETGTIQQELVIRKITQHLRKLFDAACHVIVVTNNVFEDGKCNPYINGLRGFAAYENYAPETIAYIEALGQINIWLAEQADTVYEVMAGQAVCWKAEDRK